MYDMTSFIDKTWDITFVDGKKLHILPPKIKDKEKLSKYAAESEDYVANLIKCLLFIINNNKEMKVYNEDKIKELLTEEQLVNFVDNYINWISGEQKN